MHTFVTIFVKAIIIAFYSLYYSPNWVEENISNGLGECLVLDQVWHLLWLWICDPRNYLYDIVYTETNRINAEACNNTYNTL